MSLEMRVLYSGEIPEASRVTATMRLLGLDFAIADPKTGYSLGGFMPMIYDGQGKRLETGTEVYLGDAQEVIATFGISGINPELRHQISFRWGSDFMEGACATALSASIGYLTGGLIWDDARGGSISVEMAAEISRELTAAGIKQ